MTETVSDGWLLVKRGLYWRPYAQGYTGLKEEAGVYSDEQSAAYRDHDDEEVTIRIRVSEADDIAPGCSDEVRARYWQKRAEAAEAERDTLKELLGHADADATAWRIAVDRLKAERDALAQSRNDILEEAAAFKAGQAETEARIADLLKDPAAVRVNYLRGGIACQNLINEALEEAARAVSACASLDENGQICEKSSAIATIRALVKP